MNKNNYPIQDDNFDEEEYYKLMEQEEMKLLNEKLYEYSQKHKIHPIITINTSLKELAELTGVLEMYNREVEQLELAPNYEQAVELFISSKMTKLDDNKSILSKVYNRVYRGDAELIISEFFNKILYNKTLPYMNENDEIEEKTEWYFDEVSLRELAESFVLATEIDNLKLENISSESPEDDLVKKISQPVVFTMLELLGVLDYLKKEFPNQNNVAIAKLLAFLYGGGSIKSYERCLGAKGNPKNKKNPLTEDNIEICKTYLSNLSMKVINEIPQSEIYKK